MRADGEHEHREADVAEEADGHVVRVYRVKARPAEDDPGEQLADHDRDKEAAGGAHERTGQSGEHDERQDAEGHPATVADVRTGRGARGDAVKAHG